MAHAELLPSAMRSGTNDETRLKPETGEPPNTLGIVGGPVNERRVEWKLNAFIIFHEYGAWKREKVPLG